MSAFSPRRDARGQVRFERPRPPSQAKLWLIALLVAAVVWAVCWLFSRHILVPARDTGPSIAEDAER